MREHLKKLKPTCLSDLSAMNALYRPGPMQFIDDLLTGNLALKKLNTFILFLTDFEETYGIIVYQEQVIQIANIVVE